MRLHEDVTGVYSQPRHMFSFRTMQGDDVQVGWERAWPPHVPEKERNAADAPRLPWRVAYHYRGQHIATEWYDAALSPGDVDAWMRMHAIISAYEPPVPTTPPRRGLLFHLFDGVQRWYGHGN